MEAYYSKKCSKGKSHYNALGHCAVSSFAIYIGFYIIRMKNSSTDFVEIHIHLWLSEIIISGFQLFCYALILGLKQLFFLFILLLIFHSWSTWMIHQASRRNVHVNPGRHPSSNCDTDSPSEIRMQDRPGRPGILLYSCHR